MRALGLALLLSLPLTLASAPASANGVPPSQGQAPGGGSGFGKGPGFDDGSGQDDGSMPDRSTPGRSSGGTPVALELVLAVDVSTSVSAQEYALQRIGLFRAFLDPAVRASVRSHPRGIAVSVVHWAGQGRQRVAIPWLHLTDEASISAFTRKLGAMRRGTGGFTDIEGAVRFATRSLLANGYQGDRLVIDVSGDGIADQGRPAAARDDAVAQGIVVNGLAILPGNTSSANALLAHYRFDVTGGPGSFVIGAQSFDDFPRAMREKLIREISGPAFAAVPPARGLAPARGPAPVRDAAPVLPASTGGDGAL